MAKHQRTRAARQQHTRPHHREDRPVSGSFRTLLLAAVLAGAAWAAYASSFAGVFVLDDKYAILDNPHIRSLWPLTQSMAAPPENPVSGRPVASLSFAVNYALAPEDVRDVMMPGGPDAATRTEQFLRNVWGYHFFNLALHVLAGLTLFGVVRRTLATERLRPHFAGVYTPLAFTAALIWLVHPLTTDAVTYIAQRTEGLMGLFFLLTLYCAIRAGDMPATRSARRWWTAGAIAACALGMGSKQAMVSAPLLVWLWDWTFRRGADGKTAGSWTAWRTRWPLYAGLAATWSVVALSVAYERWPHSVGLNREGWTPWTYLLTQTGVLVHYLRLAFVPWPLVLDYEGWPMARSLADVAPYALLITALFVATVVGLLRRSPWAYLGAWFFAILGPSSSVLPLPTEVAAERRMYLPLAAVITLVLLGGFLIGSRLVSAIVARPGTRRRLGLATAALVVAAVAITLGTTTAARNRDYWSDERIWADTVAKRPGNPRARLNYGVDLFHDQRYAEAEQHLREAVRLKDTSAPAHGNLGALLCTTGRLDEGIPHLERAVALDPEFTDAYPNLGEAYAAQGKHALAAKYFGLAVNVDPENPFYLDRLAWLLATSREDSVRNGTRAVELAERAARITMRQDVMTLDTLAAAYAEAGRFGDAVATAREALDVAGRQGRQGAADIAGREALYRTGQKYRE